MRFVRDLRLIPVVALAAAALFVLKTSAIVIEGGYTLIASRAALAQGLGEGDNARLDLPPPAALDDAAPRRRAATACRTVRRAIRRIPGCAISTRIRAAEISPARSRRRRSREPPKDAAPAAGAPAHGTAARAARRCRKPTMSAGERAVLESLQQRRQELETRAREIEVRDSLLKAAEKRIEQRLQELKEMEARAHRRGHEEGRGGGRQVQEPRHACTRT